MNRGEQLVEMYGEVSRRLDKIDFGKLWFGFHRYEFALYNDECVVLGGEVLPKSNQFIANTAIFYEGRHIAIWNVVEEMDLDILASKMAHEMFHAFQAECGESRFPNEIDALVNYQYQPQYLSLKYIETQLLADLCEQFDGEKYKQFLSMRHLRAQENTYQYCYESNIEVIEGSAQFIELKALEILNIDKFNAEKKRCLDKLRNFQLLIPIRILCYDIGAMLLLMCQQNYLPYNNYVGKTTEFLLQKDIVEGVTMADKCKVLPEIEKFCVDDAILLRKKIADITTGNTPIAQGDFLLKGVNVYSARYLDGYIYSQYFVCYSDGQSDQPIFEYGNFLLKMNGDKISAIYRED